MGHTELDDPFLDVFEAAAIAKLHPQTIRKACQKGRLRYLKINGGRVMRFRRSWVLAWLEGHTVKEGIDK